jgi:geranylgeranylglycerol-phosphate geranylgeranyltransferase
MPEIVSKVLSIIETSRPMIWLFAVGTAFCGMWMALKSFPPLFEFLLMCIAMISATFSANLVNAATDVEVDRINKPNRPLPEGRVTIREAFTIGIFCLLLTLIISFLFGIVPFLVAIAGLTFAVIYSVPPIALKERGLLANISLAFSYSTLIFLWGWTIVAPLILELTVIIILIFLLIQISAANIIKDLVDFEGDLIIRRTIPGQVGLKRTIVIIAPFMVGIYLFIPVLWLLKVFSWHYLPISLIALWGIAILVFLYKKPSKDRRIKAFLHAFFMSLLSEFLFAGIYVLS